MFELKTLLISVIFIIGVFRPNEVDALKCISCASKDNDCRFSPSKFEIDCIPAEGAENACFAFENHGKFDQRMVRGCLNDPNGDICKTKEEGCHRCYSDGCNNKPYGENGATRTEHISFALISTIIFTAATALWN